MTIEARHDGRAHAKDAWSARVVFTLDAGEQLTAVARDLASLLGEW